MGGGRKIARIQRIFCSGGGVTDASKTDTRVRKRKRDDREMWQKKSGSSNTAK